MDKKNFLDKKGVLSFLLILIEEEDLIWDNGDY